MTEICQFFESIDRQEVYIYINIYLYLFIYIFGRKEHTYVMYNMDLAVALLLLAYLCKSTECKSVLFEVATRHNIKILRNLENMSWGIWADIIHRQSEGC